MKGFSGFGDGTGSSPAKKMKGAGDDNTETRPGKTYSYMEDPKRERTDKQGRTQKEVLEMRMKNEKDYNEKVKEYAKKKGGLTKEQAEKANKKAKMLEGKTQYSADSIVGVNKELARQAELEMKKKRKKDDDEFDAL